jgi:hypothetical protein
VIGARRALAATGLPAPADYRKGSPVMFIIAAVIAAIHALVGVPTTPDGGRELPSCHAEDQTTACYWDASEHGNGTGRDFYVDDQGRAHFVTGI